MWRGLGYFLQRITSIPQMLRSLRPTLGHMSDCQYQGMEQSMEVTRAWVQGYDPNKVFIGIVIM